MKNLLNKTKKLGFVLIAVASLLTLSPPQNAKAQSLQGIARVLPMLTTASLPVVGPKGEIIVYENKNGKVTIRQCAPGTSKVEIESEDGCNLAKDKKGNEIPVISLSENDFETLMENTLSNLDRSQLDESQRKLLELAQSELENLDQNRQTLEELKRREALFLEQKKNFPNNYDHEALQNIQNELIICESKIETVQDALDARIQLEQMLSDLKSHMNGREIKQMILHSREQNTIAFQLLKGIINIESCSDLVKKSPIPVGSFCKTSRGGVFQRKENGFTDLKSGFTWYDEVAGGISQTEAIQFCRDKKLELPTAYTHIVAYSNGVRVIKKNDPRFSDIDSDYAAAEKNGIREVFPDMKDKFFWSSSLNLSYEEGVGEIFHGNGGYIFSDVSVRNDERFFARCISREPSK